MSPEVVDEFLRSGGNQRHGVLHIIAYHQLWGQDFPKMLRQEFCRDGLGDGGRGLLLNGEQYAAWYDVEGIHVAKGSTIHTKNASLFTWEQAAERIGFLLDHGLYQPEVVIRQAVGQEHLEIAEQLWYLHQDYNSEHPFPFFMEESLFDGGFPESTARIAELLKNRSELYFIQGGLGAFAGVYDDDPSILRWHYHHPAALYRRMSRLDNERRQYPMSNLAVTERRTFLTQDEIDAVIRNRSSSFSERNLTIYAYLIHDPAAADAVKFFKNLYGITGWSHAISHADDSFLDYDSKGVTLKRGDVTLRLNWNQYVRRARELVLAGGFLTQETVNRAPEFERRELAKRVVRFFRLRPARSPLLNTFQNEDTTNRTSELLSGTETLNRILDAMRLTMTELDEGQEHYQTLMDIYNDMLSFQAGTFSLFTPAASMEAEAQKRGATLFLHPGQNLPREEMVYQYREGSTVYINSDAYEVSELDGAFVSVRDASFPLLAKRYTREELDTLLRRDARNDYLLIAPVVSQREGDTQDVVENPVLTVQNQPEETAAKSEETEVTEAEQAEPTQQPEPETNRQEEPAPAEKEPEPAPETERQRERETGEEPEPDSGQETEEQDPLYVYEPFRVEDVEQDPEEEEEDELPYEVVLAPTVDLVGLYAIFSRDEDDYVRDGDEIRGFETREDAEAFIDALLEGQTLDEPPEKPEQKPEPEPVPAIQQPEPQEPVNFRITDDALGTGGAKAKFQRNLAAIELVHRLEREGRMATAEEQAVLAQYVGWGGIAQVFDENNAAWSEEYKKLRAELTPEEYAAARGSTLNAHYTSPVVIREMYGALERMGFTGGNLLEPAMGVGNFFGMVPDSLRDSTRLYGVELDEITGKIAQQLYQQAEIAVKGFEKTAFSNDFFDVAIGNVPFGNYQVSDRAYDRHHFMIHDYFLAKSLDKVRPGGVLAVITSAGTLDKKDEAPRRYLAERATLLGAVRLPNNAFLANAGTSVVTDILFLQKRDAPTAEIPDWVHLGVNEAGFQCNRYFVEHPDMVLGEWTSESTQYGLQAATINPIEGADLGQQLHEAMGKIEGSIQLSTQEVEELEEEAVTIPADPSVRNFSYTVVDDEVFYRENSVMRKVDMPAATMERIKGMVAIRDVTQRLINAQLWESSDGEIIALQQQLNAEYDRFTKKYGIISSSGNKRAFALDSSYCLLKSLEVLDDEGNLKRKADMFTKR